MKFFPSFSLFPFEVYYKYKCIENFIFTSASLIMAIVLQLITYIFQLDTISLFANYRFRLFRA